MFDFSKFSFDAGGATVASVNTALRARGVKERLVRGRGYYYFMDGDASSWPSSSVYMNDVGAWTVEQWLREYEHLKAAR